MQLRRGFRFKTYRPSLRKRKSFEISSEGNVGGTNPRTGEGSSAHGVVDFVAPCLEKKKKEVVQPAPSSSSLH